MSEINTSLLREKFTIHDPHANPRNAKPVIALSNRIELNFSELKKDNMDIFIVRAQNMHSCIRMAARLVQAFLQSGPILKRQTPFDWDKAWDGIVNDYEYTFNPQRWVAVYHQGRPVFERGMRHPFLDVIEKYEDKNEEGYDMAIPMAENAFKQTGKNVKIDYDGNVALVVNLSPTNGRIGVILRGADKTTTFNFSVRPRVEKVVHFPQCMLMGASFLEGIQLAFMIGFNEEKIRRGMIERFSKEEKQTREARKRLTQLTADIENFESAYDIRYRPERPQFHHILADAEELAQRVLS